MPDDTIDGINPWPVAIAISLWLWGAIFYAARVIG
jgi:hypothetical protein